LDQANNFQAKGIRYKNEMLDDSSTLLKAALQDQDLASTDEDEGGVRGSADEDDESPDEDFHADSDSDVAEEFDSAHDSSGEDSDAGSNAGSDAEMADAGDDEVDAVSDEEEKSRPKKKSKK
jgi:structure-specific recognition protein 1